MMPLLHGFFTGLGGTRAFCAIIQAALQVREENAELEVFKGSQNVEHFGTLKITM